jgi:NAD(P)-dependent dehydrogenase (short-subunit alcohol dehydrogenase family)
MPTAFVTGASRGIGKAIAIHLAKAGYDVAVTARTVQDGRGARALLDASQVGHDHPCQAPSRRPPSSIREPREARCLTVPADLTDRHSVIAAAKGVLSEWGAIDVLVNNGRYIGPGHMDRFVDTPLELLDRHLEANVMAPLALIKEFLPGMLERGSGTIVNISSGAGTHDPTGPAAGRRLGAGLRHLQGRLAPGGGHPGARAE